MHESKTRHLTATTAIAGTTLQRWRNVIARRPELNDLYTRLGYSQHQVNALSRIIDQCFTFVDFDISDIAVFRKAVSESLAAPISVGDTSIDSQLLASLSDASDLTGIRQALGDKLARIAPIDRCWHFRSCLGLPEQVNRMLRIRVLDEDLLRSSLEELKYVIEYGPQPQSLKDKALDAIEAFRQFSKCDPQVTDLRAGLEKMAEKLMSLTMWDCHDSVEVNERRRQLNEIVIACEGFREEFNVNMNVNKVGFAGNREGVERAARMYLDSDWMYHPAITGYVASTLIQTVLAPLLYPRKLFIPGKWKNGFKLALLILASVYLAQDFSRGTGWLALLAAVVQYGEDAMDLFRRREKACGALNAISEEFDAGCYDAPTSARRLEEWEKKGYAIPSLVYALLRIRPKDQAPGYSVPALETH